MNREVQVRICEHLGVKFPGVTRLPGRNRGGYPTDEPVGQRRDKGRACSIEAKALLIHPSHQGACGRHGTEDQCVTSGGLAGSRVAPGKRAYKRERNGEQSPVSSRTASWYLKRSQKLRDQEIGGESGAEREGDEGGWERERERERGSQMRKGGEEDQFDE